MTTNWDDLEGQYGGSRYAEAGTYEVQIEDIEVKEVGSKGSIAINFLFSDQDGIKFPKVTHWLTFKEGKDGWRKWHNKCIFEMLIGSEDKAKQTIDVCEEKSGKDGKVKAYEQAYKKAAAKHPKVEIEVWQDGKYSEADFTKRDVRMGRPGPTQAADEAVNILDDDSDISADDIPFN